VGDREASAEPAVTEGAERESDVEESSAGFVGCDETIERLYFYLDGELTEERRTEIARHLDLCGPCVGAYGFESELRRVIASRCRDHVPDELITRVADAIRDEHSRQSN
jgi:mycothiol system anti-sigma-R factor